MCTAVRDVDKQDFDVFREGGGKRENRSDLEIRMKVVEMPFSTPRVFLPVLNIMFQPLS